MRIDFESLRHSAPFILPRPLPQPHARPVAVLSDEDDAAINPKAAERYHEVIWAVVAEAGGATFSTWEPSKDAFISFSFAARASNVGETLAKQAFAAGQQSGVLSHRIRSLIQHGMTLWERGRFGEHRRAEQRKRAAFDELMDRFVQAIRG